MQNALGQEPTTESAGRNLSEIAVLLYLSVFGLSIWVRPLENSLMAVATIPVVLIAASSGLRRALLHAALASTVAWAAGLIHQSGAWVMVASMQSTVFFGAAVACAGARAGQQARLQRQAAHADAIATRERVLQAQVDQLNAEVNKSIFDILAIYEFTTVLGSTLHLDDIFNMMVDTIMRVVRYDACFVALAEETSNEVQIKVGRAFSPEQLKRFAAAVPGQGIVGRVLHTAQPLIIPDLDRQTWSQEYKRLKYKSMLSLPLVIHGRAIGVLNLFKEEVDGFTQDDLRVLFIVANQCAFAVQNGKLYEEMARLAITDGLTGLYNHRYFMSVISDSVDRAKKEDKPVSMIMVDADGFKSVNDRFGHQRGDQVLQQIAARTLASVRESDLVARYGGEEFAVVLPGTNLQDALVVAERIHQSIQEHDFDGLRMTVSVGLATFPSPKIHNKDELIGAADDYAYVAKESGRNRVCWGEAAS